MNQNELDLMLEHLKKMGFTLRVQHFTGDNAYPTEYTLERNGVSMIGPTPDLTLLWWLEKFLKETEK